MWLNMALSEFPLNCPHTCWWFLYYRGMTALLCKNNFGLICLQELLLLFFLVYFPCNFLHIYPCSPFHSHTTNYFMCIQVPLSALWCDMKWPWTWRKSMYEAIYIAHTKNCFYNCASDFYGYSPYKIILYAIIIKCSMPSPL